MKEITNIPEEVQIVSALSTLRHVGSETFKRIIKAYADYPDWFPEEYSYYHVVPKEVHTKYHTEVTDKYHEIYPENKLEEGVGIMEQIRRRGEIKPSKQPLGEILAENERKHKLYHKAKKQIWEKHYKKFGIKYESE